MPCAGNDGIVTNTLCCHSDQAIRRKCVCACVYVDMHVGEL